MTTKNNLILSFKVLCVQKTYEKIQIFTKTSIYTRI